MVPIDFNSPQGKQLLKNLYAFSYGLFNRLYKMETNEKGKSFRDYVHEALDRHFRGQDVYDPNKSPLEYHLKYHVIRRQIYNDLPVEKKREREVPVNETPPPDSALLNLSEHDRNLLFSEIEASINGDDIVERIYLAVAHEKFNLSDRAEICEEYEISVGDFDNGRRRFLTILRKIFKKLDLIPQGK